MSNNIVEFGKQKLMIAMLKECAPDVFEACELLSEPLLIDWDLLPNVHDQIQLIEGLTTCENIHVVMAVLDRLFMPVQILFNQPIRKPNGLRDAYSKLFKYDNPENINYWISIMRPHYKNPRFAERIDQIAFKVYEILKTNGDIMDNSPKITPSAHPFENIKNDGFLAKMVKSRVSGLIAHITGAENSLLF